MADDPHTPDSWMAAETMIVDEVSTGDGLENASVGLEPTMDSLQNDSLDGLEAASLDVSPGVRAHQRLGEHFEVIRRLGAGGMGEVYLARDVRLNRRVAIKTILATRMIDPSRRERQLSLFRRDAAATARLQHPNIVTIHELGVDEAQDLPFIVLEYLEGMGLDELLSRGPLPIARSLEILEQVAHALTHAHEKGIVHRDLKPANIFILEDGTTKVLDFGVALIRLSQEQMRQEFERDDEALDAYLGEELGVAGTPSYMAPEQSLGEEQGPTVDIWAVGIILYRLLTGELPFKSPLAAALRPMPLPSSLRADVPAAVDRLVLECTQRDPLRRLQRADELARLLADVRATITILPDAPGSERDAAINYAPPEDLYIPRAELTAQLDEVLAEHRLVTLTGSGGCGKTRLASEFGALRKNQWPGGVWKVDLADAHSLQGVLLAIAAAFDVQLTGAEPLVQLGDVLANRDKALVLFDNFEQILSLADIVLGYLLERCPSATFMVTSRARLGLREEVVVEVSPMPIPAGDDLALAQASPAVALFVARAAASAKGFALSEDNAAALCELVRLLDGLPLALELAAARVRVMPPAKMLRRLGRRFDLLKTSRRDLDPRQATLRATIDWSWDLLDERARVGLAQLSVFEGGFTLEAAEEVLDFGGYSPRPFVFDVLENLLEKSLVQREASSAPGHGARFSMLVSIHAYASEKLEQINTWIAAERVEWASGLHESAHRAHGDFFARLGERSSLERLYRMGGLSRQRALHRELDNLSAAHARAIGRGEHRVATLAALAMGASFELHGPFPLGVEIFGGILKEAPGLERLMGRAWHVSGRLCWMAGQNEDARIRYERALEGAITHEDAELEAEVSFSLGVLLGEFGEVDEALAMLARAEEIARAIPQERLLANISVNRGILFQHRGEMERASALYEDARALAASVGALSIEAVTYSNIGVLAFALGRLDESRQALERSVDLARQAGARRVEAGSMGNLAFLAQQQGRMEDAEQGSLRSLELARAMGNRRTEGIVLGNLASLYMKLDRYEDARQGLEDAHRIAEQLLDLRWLGYWKFQIGEVLILQGRAADALEILDAAIAIFDEVEERERGARARAARGRALHAMGQEEEAALMLAAARESLAALDAGEESELAISIATLARLLGDA